VTKFCRPLERAAPGYNQSSQWVATPPVVTSKSKKSRSASNQIGNAFQTLFFNDFARDSQNSGKRLRAARFYTF